MNNLDAKYSTRPGFEPKVSSHNRIEWAMGWLNNKGMCAAVYKQTTVTAYLSSKDSLLFVLSLHYG